MHFIVDLLHKELLHSANWSRLHIMCNAKLIIAALGGASKVAKDYGFSAQRVCNWGLRGIPASVILGNPGFARALAEAGYEHKQEERSAA